MSLAEDKKPDSEAQSLRNKNVCLISSGLITCTSQDIDILKKLFPKESLTLWPFELGRSLT